MNANCYETLYVILVFVIFLVNVIAAVATFALPNCSIYMYIGVGII